MSTEIEMRRTPVRQLAGKIAGILRKENPDYANSVNSSGNLGTELTAEGSGK